MTQNKPPRTAWYGSLASDWTQHRAADAQELPRRAGKHPAMAAPYAPHRAKFVPDSGVYATGIDRGIGFLWKRDDKGWHRVGTVITHKEKGGDYQFLGTARGAGDMRDTACVVYLDTETGQLYFRNLASYAANMVEA